MITSSLVLGTLGFADYATEGWSFNALTDWWGQTEDKAERTERPQGHGAFAPSRSLRASRAISVEVNYLGRSQADVENAFDTLSAIGADGPVLMTVNTPAGSSWRVVTVEKVTPLNHKGGARRGFAAVDLIAHDPRRYRSGEWLSTPPPSPGQGEVWPEINPVIWPGGGSSGRIELVNDGKAPSAPAFRLGGAFTSALITCVDTGARVGLDRPVPAGSFVEIDFTTRRAMLDGLSDVSRWLRFREWTEVPGRMSRTYQFDATEPTGAVMQGMVNHAWW